MATTANKGYYKPSRTDNTVEVDKSLADNFDKIDADVTKNENDIAGHIAGTNGQHTSEVITHADGNVKATLDNHEERLGNAEAELTDHEGRLTDIETLGLDLLGPDVENRIATLESDVEGVLAPATFDAMNQQSYTFDEYRIGYVNNKMGDPSLIQIPGVTTPVAGINYLNSQLAEKVKKGEQLVFVKDYGAVGDGITDDTTSIQNAINYANSNNLPVLFEPKEYLISQVTFKKTRYYLNGTSFKMKNTLIGNIYALDFEVNTVADYVQLTIPNANMGERFIRVQGGCVIEQIKINALSQQATFNDNLDGAVNLTGSNHWIGNIDVKNCDYAVVLYNCLSSYVGRVKVDNYIRGLYVRMSKDLQINSVRTSTMSANAGQNPGHNGILVEECEEIRFPSVHINDSGEHGIRIGGTQSGTYLQKRISFGNVVTRRTGQCGFKAFTGSTNLITYLSIASLHVYDCAYANTPGTNEDGLYLVNCQHVNVGEFFLDSELNAVSAYDGFYASGCQFINIGNMNIRNVTNNGFLIDEVNGAGATNDFYVESITIRKCGAEGILINHPTQILRDVIIKNIYLREFGVSSYGVKVMANSISVGVNQPVLLDGYVSKGTSTGIFFTNTTDADLYNKLVQLT